MEFSRTKNIIELVENLKQENLYNELIQNDENVFVGLRDNAIDFYYGGSKIYSYTKKDKFLSHKKFCINANTNSEYIKQNEINSISLISNPLENYKLIKQNAKKYAGIEGDGISNLFKQDYKSGKKYFLLDIEIALYDKTSNDRIDLLLYDNENCVLKFVEAKHFSNSELWSQKGTLPKVVSQINRYDKRLKDENYYTNILDEYKRYIVMLNKIFNLDITEPKKICKETSLYMFGFDENQKNKITNLLTDDNSLETINYYFLGNPKTAKIETIFKGIKNGKN